MSLSPRPAGRFRHRVTVERKSTVSDGMGGVVEGWTTIASGVACLVEETRGGETVQADRLSSLASVNIHLRKTAAYSIETSDRLVNDRTGEVYSIKWVGSLDDLERDLLVVATKGEVSRA